MGSKLENSVQDDHKCYLILNTQHHCKQSPRSLWILIHSSVLLTDTHQRLILYWLHPISSYDKHSNQIILFAFNIMYLDNTRMSYIFIRLSNNILLACYLILVDSPVLNLESLSYSSRGNPIGLESKPHVVVAFKWLYRCPQT